MFNIRTLLKMSVICGALSMMVLTGCARKTPEKLIAEVQEANKTGDIAGAVAKLEEFIERYPKDERSAFAQMNIADSYARMGQFDRSIKEFQKAIDNYPNNKGLKAGAQLSIANCYGAKKDWTKAREIWQTLAVDSNNGNAMLEAKNSIARSYSVTGEFAKAEAAYKDYLNTISIIPQMPKNQKEALLISGYVALAESYAMATAISKTEATLKSLKSKFPNNQMAEDYYLYSDILIGGSYDALKQTDKAKTYYKKGLVAYSAYTAYPAPSKDTTAGSRETLIAQAKADGTLIKMSEIYAFNLKDPAKASELLGMVAKRNKNPKVMNEIKQRVAYLSSPQYKKMIAAPQSVSTTAPAKGQPAPVKK